MTRTPFIRPRALALVLLLALPGAAMAEPGQLTASSDVHDAPNGNIVVRLEKARSQVVEVELLEPQVVNNGFVRIKVRSSGLEGWVRKHQVKSTHEGNPAVTRASVAEPSTTIPGVTRGASRSSAP
jgi:hypothetical protein